MASQTRRLAARLGVQSPALYWYVRDKGELLDLVADAICAPALEPIMALTTDASLGGASEGRRRCVTIGRSCDPIATPRGCLQSARLSDPSDGASPMRRSAPSWKRGCPTPAQQ